MTSFKKYFWYHFKSTFLRCAIMTVLGVILTFMSVSAETHHNVINHYRQTHLYSNIGILSFIAATVSALLPIFELSKFKNRRNIDTMLFMPISRTKMAMAHWLNCVLQIIIINFACFSTVALMFLPLIRFFPIWYLLPFFLATCLACIVLYSFLSFVFSQANTVADGVLFMVIYSLIGMLIVGSFHDLFHIKPTQLDFSYFSPFSPFFVLSRPFDNIITPSITMDLDGNIQSSSVSSATTRLNFADKFTLVFWGIMGVAAIFGYVFCFTKQKAEKVGDVSDSPFGYKVLIPLFAIPMFLIVEDIILGAFVIIATTIGYIIYRRGFKFKFSDILMMAVSLAVAVTKLTGVI